MEALADSSTSWPKASMTSGLSSNRRCCSGVSRFWTYLSSRISVSDLPRSCSRTTYRATCSSAEPRENRNENMFLNPDTRRDCIPGVRRSSREGRYAERALLGVDDVGEEEQVVIWIERRAGALWAVGRAVNPQLRESDEARPEDLIFEGY